MISVDKFLPEFIKAEDTAIVSDPWSPDAIYTAVAYDGDMGTTCPTDALLCDCAEISYDITAGDTERLFHINNVTGDVHVKEASRVKSGGAYNLTITASTSKGKVSSSSYAHLQVCITGCPKF